MAKNQGKTQKEEVLENNTNVSTDVKDSVLEHAPVVQSKASLTKAKDLSKLLDGFEEANAIEVTSEYLKFEDDGGEEEFRFVFSGMTSIKNQYRKSPNDPEFVDAVRMINKEGRFFVSAEAMLVGTCLDWFDKSGDPIPTPFSVRCVGMKQGKAGSYKKLVIKQLF